MLAWTPGSEPCKSSIELSLTLRIDFQCLFLPRVMSASTQTKAWADGKVQEGTVPAGGPPSPPVLRLYPPGRRALILTFLFFSTADRSVFSLIIVLNIFLEKSREIWIKLLYHSTDLLFIIYSLSCACYNLMSSVQYQFLDIIIVCTCILGLARYNIVSS